MVDDIKLNHREFIHGVVAWMATNSFLFKGMPAGYAGALIPVRI